MTVALLNHFTKIHEASNTKESDGFCFSSCSEMANYGDGWVKYKLAFKSLIILSWVSSLVCNLIIAGSEWSMLFRATSVLINVFFFNN